MSPGTLGRSRHPAFLTTHPRSIRIGPFTNIDRDPRGPAWTVVVKRRGRNYPKYFSDAVWGGRAKALVAARRWRDELLRRIDPDTRVRRRPPRGSRNRTGIVGVTLELHKVGGRVYERYVAMWPDPEKGGDRRRFQVARYGRKRAKALAKEARQAGLDRYAERLLARQRQEAAERLRQAPPTPRQVKDPADRRGISMAARRPRRARRADGSQGRLA